MKNKNIYFLIGMLFMVMFIVDTPSARANQTISTVVEKDSYVESYYSTSNNGGKNWLIFGDYFLGWNEAYLYFDFSDKPMDWIRAEISIRMYSVSETFDITVSLINDVWGEYTINWLNKPNHGEIISTFMVAEGKVYTIDITNYIEGNGISICLNASDYLQTGYVQATSEEGSSWLSQAPTLTWTSEPTPIPDPFPLDNTNVLQIIIVLATIGVIIIVYIIFKKKSPKEVMIVHERDIPKITYCPECGIKITGTTKDYCSQCGNKIIN